MKSKTRMVAAALVSALLMAACKTSPPAPPTCDGKAKKPINGRTLTSYAPMKELSDGCGRS